MGFLDGLISALTDDYTGTDASNGSKLGSALGNLLKQSLGDLTPNQSNSSYDGLIVAGGFEGEYRQSKWMKIPNDEISANFLLNTFNGKLNCNYEITKLFCMGENVDQEEQEMIPALVNFIINNYQINNHNAFSHIVLRGTGDAGLDGWVVYSYFQVSDGWTHIIYYFAIEYR